MARYRYCVAGLVLWVCAGASGGLRVPACTGYLDPDVRGARVSAEGGVTHWVDPNLTLTWYGHFTYTGDLRARVELGLPAGTECTLRLAVDGQERVASVRGAGERTPVMADLGTFSLTRGGYQAFDLRSPRPPGGRGGAVRALLLDGPATEGVHFNLKARRNASSVHLRYPVPADVNVAAFTCEVTGLADPLWTYYMACGWHRGYFGMQVNSPTERRIIFSVWDSGGEGVDRDKVASHNRVTLVAKGPGVVANDFGNEGTGGHSHLVTDWRTGQPQRFLVTAEPVDGVFTIYSGYYRRPGSGRWMLISSWKAPHDGGFLKRLYSFSENFVGHNGHLRRKARFGGQWIRTETGRWLELTEARFSYDATGRSDRFDRFMGVEDGQFFLSQGGFVPGTSSYGATFFRPATGRAPTDLEPLLRTRQP